MLTRMHGRLMLLGPGLAIAALLALMLASWLIAERFMRLSGELMHRAEILVPMEHAATPLLEISWAQRGWFVSRSADYLSLRQAAIEDWQRTLARAESQVGNDAVLAERIAALRRLGAERIAQFDAMLALFERDPEQVRRMMAAGHGRDELMTAVRSLHALADEQYRALRERADAAREQASWMLVMLGLAAVAVCTALVVLTAMMRRRTEALERATAELADSRARLGAIVDTTLEAIVVIDRRGTVEQFNAGAERLFGWPAAEVLGRNVSLLMPMPDRERHDAYIGRYLADGQARVIGRGREVTALRRDGSTVPVELMVTETRVHGQLLFTGLMRDISQRRRAEAEQQRLVAELRAANEELRMFSAVASHDLKAPLRGVASLARWLWNDQADRLDEAGRRQLQLLTQRVERMGSLVDGVVQYARVGPLEAPPPPLDLGKVVGEVIDLLAPPAHLTVRVGELPVVAIEPGRAQHLFQNLLSNAIQYHDKPEGWILVECADEGEHWHFQVRDNGPGIERRHWERVFDLFQSLPAGARHGGSGIGLPLVKKIVEMERGRIWLESEPGEGSSFHFTLPRPAAVG